MMSFSHECRSSGSLVCAFSLPLGLDDLAAGAFTTALIAPGTTVSGAYRHCCAVDVAPAGKSTMASSWSGSTGAGEEEPVGRFRGFSALAGRFLFLLLPEGASDSSETTKSDISTAGYRNVRACSSSP